MSDSEIKYLNLAGYICHALMMNQIMPIKKIFELCQRFSKAKFKSELSQSEFDNIINELYNGAAITGIVNGYIYQTTSGINPQKSHDEIMAFLKP